MHSIAFIIIYVNVTYIHPIACQYTLILYRMEECVNVCCLGKHAYLNSIYIIYVINVNDVYSILMLHSYRNFMMDVSLHIFYIFVQRQDVFV